MLKECLKGTKHRLTKQRRIILEEVRKVCTHPTAKQIYKLTKRRIKDISFATVYRNLDFLEQKGLIIKLKSKDGDSRYDGNADPHIHMVCKICGVVYDISDCKCAKFASKQLKKIGFVPDYNCLEVTGFCKKCKHK